MTKTNNTTVKRPLLEVVHDLLKGGKKPKTFYELIDMVPNLEGDEEEKAEYIARLYTNMNLDGRFLSIGDNFWGLRSWYPVEQREEEVAMTLAPKRRKKKKKDDDYDLDEYDELDEEDYDDLDEDYDEDYDGDEDEDFEDEFDDDDDDDDEEDDDFDDTDEDIEEDLDEEDEEEN